MYKGKRNIKLDEIKAEMAKCVRPEPRAHERYGDYMNRCIHPDGRSLADISAEYHAELSKMNAGEFDAHVIAGWLEK